MPNDRFEALCPMVGSYMPGGKALTLGDVYGSPTPEALRAAIVSDFGGQDLIPPLDARPNTDQAAETDPPWSLALRVCGAADLQGKENVFHRRDRCIDLDDTLDWLVIQLALRRSGRPASATLELPRTRGAYALNQSLSVSAGTHLRWTPGADGTYSTVVLVGTTDNGTMFTNMNPYSLDVSPTVVRVLADDIVFDEPHISGNNIKGENAISFARGSRNAIISGGEIRDLEYDPQRQGGRAVQCEQGCDGLTVRRLRIVHSTFGISSGAIQQNRKLLQPFGDLAQSRLVVRDVEMNDVEVPFSFLNTKLDKSSDPDGQSVDIDGVRIVNSGALVRAKIRSGNTDTFSYQPDDGSERVWCYDRQQLASRYELSQTFYSPGAAGIFYFQAGRDVRIRNVTVVNDPSYPKIGGLFRGEAGNTISISDVRFRGNARAVFNLTGGITGPVSNAIHLENVRFDRIRAEGEFDTAVLSADDLPVVRARKADVPGDRCARLGAGGRFHNLTWSDSTVNGRPVTGMQIPAAAPTISRTKGP
ncbi:hypothetical protein Mchl_3991 [Methylorubrum extorquens CM4]|uniref:Uncharacterized protein n=2 Tax=Methylorubrum extorquens TaxID=408 RepID=B7KYP5_METC4|nr:hypothetical protein Mchl_3991 [Methylorubrum extorquens CM4]